MSIHRPQHPDDLTLVGRIVGGDEDAAQEFAQTYTKKFEYMARRAGIPHQDCQDVAQNALLDAFGQMRRRLYRGECKLATWLSRIIHGKIVEYYRKRPVGVIKRLDDGNLEKEIAETPLMRAADAEIVVIVRETLLRMPALHRMILLLKRNEGYTLEEISRMSDMTVAQVGNRLYAAEEMFRRCLGGRAQSVGNTNRRALLPGDTHRKGEPYARSIGHQARASLPGAGDQPVADGLLLWARQRIREPIGRGAFARMRVLLA